MIQKRKKGRRNEISYFFFLLPIFPPSFFSQARFAVIHSSCEFAAEYEFTMAKKDHICGRG